MVKKKQKELLYKSQRDFSGSSLFSGGQAAYDAWAEALENDTLSGEGADLFKAETCHDNQVRMLSEGYVFAAMYINSLSREYPVLADMFPNVQACLNQPPFVLMLCIRREKGKHSMKSRCVLKWRRLFDK